MEISRVEDTHFPINRYLRIRDKLVDLSIPKVMGIINLTPDSFYANSRNLCEKDLIIRVSSMIEDGADIIDLGGYSTRPGAKEVETTEEIDRVIPAIKAIRKEFPDLVLSLDTFRSKVAHEGIQEGVDIINDVSGGNLDDRMYETVGNSDVSYILMHMRGTPQTMQEFTSYEQPIFNEMIHYFSSAINKLNQAGCKDIIIDPGFGFSKTLEQNFEVLQLLDQYRILGHPILVGVSRKSMVYKKLGLDPENALNGTTALNAFSIFKGASFLRVHDVKEAKQIISLFF